MNSFFEFVREFISFSLWTDNLGHFTFERAKKLEVVRKGKKTFAETFKGGPQKLFVLSVLIYACNTSFNNITTIQFTDLAFTVIAPIAISGFAVYFLTHLALQIITSSKSKAKNHSNLLILHLCVTLCILLAFNLTGISAYTYVASYNAFIDIKLPVNDFFKATFPIVFFSSILTTFFLYLNTSTKERSDCGGIAVSYCLFSAILLSCYLYTPLKGVPNSKVSPSESKESAAEASKTMSGYVFSSNKTLTNFDVRLTLLLNYDKLN